MEVNLKEREIILDKVLNNLDKFVWSFVRLLGDNYVIVSGYVSIITGRSRATEDVDLLVPHIDFDNFEILWNKITKEGFECINTPNVKDAFEMFGQNAIRFAYSGKAVPNIEFKQMSGEIHDYSFNNKLKLFMGDKIFFIFPIEMQIAYKLNLGSQKDLEDAKHLYDLFLEYLDTSELIKLIERFKVSKEFEIITWKK